MPQPSAYHTDDGRTFVPSTFVPEFNKYPDVHAAAEAMQIDAKRLAVICSRLRRRGFEVRRHGSGPKRRA